MPSAMVMTTAATPSGWPASCPTTDDIGRLLHGHKGGAIRPYVLATHIGGLQAPRSATDPLTGCRAPNSVTARQLKRVLRDIREDQVGADRGHLIATSSRTSAR